MPGYDAPKLFQALSTKLRIRPSVLPDSIPIIDARAQIIIDGSALLREGKNGSATLALQGAAGSYVAGLTVPLGKRWVLRGAYRASTASVSRILIRNFGEDFRLSINDTAELAIRDMVMTMPAGASIGMVTSGGAGDTAIILLISYDEEDAFL